ncbi:uncharacterized protein LAESUDRAFT_738578 [Laetiporus sulphureus 93-53]|uniref:Glyoxalase/fosfomycin resistance/dioxygenase domain-containing protein n=1 Tax=Laetiporus sulphureus 93-53 TaxID=1314785 RepID=A0A165CER2_9APHY|nr:uncharacterized protein LAESUDRAFT_738578 [Laetiporus sulphureus 93-53]KZT02680.1 hypothetical protein LAESUDRAFT_738578 [Laetiporus sulphureus 93-53]
MPRPAETANYKDPKVSLKFYVEAEFETFTLYFFSYNHGSETTDHLTHNHGIDDPGRGFAHIATAVPDVEEVCERFELLGRLSDGKTFILDPDGYWIEIIKGPLAPELS